MAELKGRVVWSTPDTHVGVEDVEDDQAHGAAAQLRIVDDAHGG